MKKWLLIIVALAVPATAQAQTTRDVCASGCTYSTIQAALDAAVCGDTVSIAYTETFSFSEGGFDLDKVCPDNNRITVRSSASDAQLPPAGQRLTVGRRLINQVWTADGSTDYRPFMPLVRTINGNSTVRTSPGASGYYIRGIEFRGAPNGVGEVVDIGDASSAQQFVSQEPSYITLDQVFVSGSLVSGQKVGVDLNGRHLAIINSHVERIAGYAQDAIGVRCVNGSGPITIRNNFISGAGYPFICGGADPEERTFTDVAVSPAPTTSSATLENFRTGHTIATLRVGQHISILANGTERYQSFVTGCGVTTPGATCTSNSITFEPIAAVPDTGAASDIRWGQIFDGFDIRRNHFAKPLEMLGPFLPTMGTVTSSTSTASGTLAGGTYYYRVQGMNTDDGYYNFDVFGTASTEVTVTLGATGQVTLTWTDIGGTSDTGEEYITHYNIGRGPSGAHTSTTNTSNVFASVARATACTGGTCTFVDTGSAMTVPNDICTSTSNYRTICSANTWVIKNGFEIKQGLNYLITGNIIEYSVTGDESGYGIWVKTTNSGGACEFCRTANVTFEWNLIRHVPGAFSILGRINASNGTGENQSFMIENLTIRNNLVDDSSSAWLQGKASTYAIKIEGGTENVQIYKNTFVHTMRGLLYLYRGDGDYNNNFVFRDNIGRKETYGIFGPGCTQGTGCLDGGATNWSAPGNTIAGASCSSYPATTQCPSTTNLETIHFVDWNGGNGGNYALQETSTLKGTASDGGDPGVDITELNTRLVGVFEGAPEGGGGVTPVNITTSGLSNGTQNSPYNATLNATGGVTPYSWSVFSGTLPAGITLSSGGVLSGTPTVSGTFNFTVRVTDSNTPTVQTDDQPLTLTLAAAATPLNITTSTLPDAQIPREYNQTIVATGGTTPYVWDVASGSIPPGLTLGANGIVSGIPTTLGTYNFTARVTDAGSVQDSQALTIIVNRESFTCADRLVRSNYTEAVIFRRPTPPTSTDCPMIGDTWIDNSVSPPVMRLITGTTPDPITFSDPIVPSGGSSHTLVSHSDVEQPANVTDGTLLLGTSNATWTFLDPSQDGYVRNVGGSLSYSLDGSILTGLNGSNIATGTVAPARLGSGTRDGTRFLRDDGTWQVASGGGGSGASTITLYAGQNATTSNVPAGGSEVNGSARNRIRVDTQGYTLIALFGWVSGCAASGTLDVQYWNGSAWASAGPSEACAAAGLKEGAFVSLPAGARAQNTIFRAYWNNGDGVADPNTTMIQVQFRP